MLTPSSFIMPSEVIPEKRRTLTLPLGCRQARALRLLLRRPHLRFGRRNQVHLAAAFTATAFVKAAIGEIASS